MRSGRVVADELRRAIAKRAAFVASLAERLQALALAGDVEAACAASDASGRLLGSTTGAQRPLVVDAGAASARAMKTKRCSSSGLDDRLLREFTSATEPADRHAGARSAPRPIQNAADQTPLAVVTQKSCAYATSAPS